MNSFEILLQEFDETLRKYNLDIYKRLQAPLKEDAIEKYLKKLGITDNHIYSLFKWKNGFSENIRQNMIFDFECSMFSLSNLLECVEKNYFSSIESKGLVLLFDNQEEGFLFNTNVGVDYGKIHLYSVPLLSIDYPLSYYDSLYSMIQTTIELYKNGGLVYNKQKKCLDSNIDINIEVYSKFNKESNFYEV